MITVRFEKSNNRIAAYDEEKNIGEATYSVSDNVWIIDHTFVDDAYRGQKIAERLVKEAVESAKRENVKIVPLCPYAKHEFTSKPEYEVVWKK